MTIRIAASFLGILAIGLTIAPIETSARGGAFAGGHAMSFHRGFRAPMIRSRIAQPQRVASPARIHAARFAHFRHPRVPVVVWVGAPWYSGYDDSTYVAPDEQSSPDSTPTTDSNVMPPRLGCRTQTYKVRSEDGGGRTVNVVRC
jgi:hypothetical protein